MFLGSPVVGYFREPRIGRAFASALSSKLDNLPEGGKFEINFRCWTDEDTEFRCEKDLTIDKPDFIQTRDPLLRKLKDLITRHRVGGLQRYQASEDPGFRFVIADGREAIFWLLADPSQEAGESERKKGRRRGGGFTTDRAQMIELLKGVFQEKVWRDVDKAQNQNSPYRGMSTDVMIENLSSGLA